MVGAGNCPSYFYSYPLFAHASVRCRISNATGLIRKVPAKLFDLDLDKKRETTKD